MRWFVLDEYKSDFDHKPQIMPPPVRVSTYDCNQCKHLDGIENVKHCGLWLEILKPKFSAQLSKCVIERCESCVKASITHDNPYFVFMQPPPICIDKDSCSSCKHSKYYMKTWFCKIWDIELKRDMRKAFPNHNILPCQQCRESEITNAQK